MTTSGKLKWQKYFSTGDVETKVKNGFGKAKFYKDSSSKDIIDLIDEGTSLKVLKVRDYNPRYYVYCNGNYGYVSGKLIQKPKREKGPTENLRIYAKELAVLGKKDCLYWNNTLIDCISFIDSKEIIDSILCCLKNNKNISQEIIDQIDKRLHNLNFRFFWDACIDYHEINELGKYLNEMLIGIILLNEKKIQKFVIPLTQNFAGIDSFGIKQKDIIPISSKYGVGAVPQLFGLLGKIPWQNFTARSKTSQVYRLLKSYEKTQSQRMAVYDFAITKLLRLSYDINEIYKSCQAKKKTAELQKLESIVRKTCVNKKILDTFPLSLTSWLERLTVDSLNSCPMSVEIVKNHLEELNLYQYHLNKNDWHEGKIVYLEKKTWECPFSFCIGKSLINNLEANRGLLCYRIGNLDEIL